MSGWPDGYDCIVLDEVDSTMAEARRRAEELRAPTWLLAHRQTDARGRRGRRWSMPGGNFAATLFFRPNCDAQLAAVRSFVAAVALYQTLAAIAGAEKLALKWPNDVLLNGGKVAGILLESSGAGDKVNWLSIGIGVNLASAPAADQLEPGAVTPVSLSQEVGISPEPEAFLTALAGHFAVLERQLTEFGFDPIRRIWLRHAARLGEPITARTARETMTGTFETVDMTGALVLTTAKGRRIIPSADIYFS